MYRCSLPLAIITAGVLASCSKSDTSASRPEEKQADVAEAQPSRPLLQACALLTKEEIASVQGEEVKETKTLEKTERGVVVSLCFFILPTPINTINLRLVQRAVGPEGRDPRQVWKEAFAPEKLRASKRPPENIPAVGEEAFWRQDKDGSALFVLKGNAYIQIGIGGADDKETEIKKCSALAEMALKRL
jgi:hypothetical protein